MSRSALLSIFRYWCLLLLTGVSVCAAAQTTAQNEWTWVGGSETSYSPNAPSGVYGTLGVPAAGNLPPARGLAATWTDSNGNLWLFGGTNGGSLNDMWEFNTSTQQWTWMGGSTDDQAPGVYGTLGVPASSNIPGARLGAASWTDSSGNFWLFAGDGVPNDLWEFNPSTNEWAWMGGSSTASCGYSGCMQTGIYGTLGVPAVGNIPGTRLFSSHWVDKSGNFWLFGGLGYDAAGKYGSLNDLWEFNPSTGVWAWIGGSSTISCIQDPNVNCGQPGVYGTLGTPSAGSIPGGRSSATSWTDAAGNLWLFGGFGLDANDNITYLNDVWRFNPSTNDWTWMGGSPTMPNDTLPGIYGTLGVPAAGNIPPVRSDATGWTDSHGYLWLFGGVGFSTVNTSLGYLNDLWAFSPYLNEWAWMGGSNAPPPYFAGLPGVYGTLGVPAPGNMPGGRQDAVNWTDHQGNLWLFGGLSNPANGYFSYFNDLWAYQPAAPMPVTATPTFSPAAGTYNQTQMVVIADATSGATIYYTTDGSMPTATSAVYSSPIAVASNETLKAVALASGYSVSAVATATYTITPPAATPSFSPAAGTYPAAQTVKISDATPGASIYYTTDGTTPSTGSTLYSSALPVKSSETIQAVAIAAGYSSSAVASASYTINLPKDFSVAASPNAATVNAGSNATTTLTLTPMNGFSAAVSFTCSGLPAGATCTFSPATVTPSGTGTASTSLTIATTSTSAALRLYANPVLRGLAFAGALFCFTRRRRRSLQFILVLMVSVLGVDLLGGCGGGTSSPGGSNASQPAVTSTITITAASGSLQHATTFSLTVH